MFRAEIVKYDEDDMPTFCENYDISAINEISTRFSEVCDNLDYNEECCLTVYDYDGCVIYYDSASRR